MTDFPALGTEHRAGLARAVRREVVVEQEIFLVLATDGIDDLAIAGGAERGGDDRLGLAASEQGRAVGARQDAGADGDRADRAQVATIDPHLGVEHLVAHGAVFEFGKLGSDTLAIPRLGLCIRMGKQGVDGVLAQRGDGVLALGLDGDPVGIGQSGTGGRFQGGDQCMIGFRSLPGERLGADFGNEGVDRVDRGLQFAMAEHHRAKHHVLGQQLGLGLDHQHGIGGAGDHQFEFGLLQLAGGRVEQVATVPITDLGGTDRPGERCARQGERGRSADHGRNIAIDLRIHRHDRGDDLGLVAEALRKQRTDRPIDQARGQSFLLGGTPLTLEESTGNAAAGVELFLIVDGERKEIEPLAQALVDHGGNQYHRVGHPHQNGATGLTGDLARLQRDRMVAELETLAYFRHEYSPCR